MPQPICIDIKRGIHSGSFLTRNYREQVHQVADERGVGLGAGAAVTGFHWRRFLVADHEEMNVAVLAVPWCNGR